MYEPKNVNMLIEQLNSLQAYPFSSRKLHLGVTSVYRSLAHFPNSIF